MANANNPHGIGVLRRRGGGPLETMVFKKLAAFATAIFKGDVVMQKAGDATSGRIVEPGLTTPGTTLPSGVALNWGAALTLTDQFVFIDTDLVGEIQDDDDTDGFTAANEGLNALLNVSTAGNATTKLSGHQIDEANIATTGSSDLHCLGKFLDPTNDYGPWCRVEVVFCHHRMGLGSAGV